MKTMLKPEITLGNILQIIVMLGGMVAYFVNVEHRMTLNEQRTIVVNERMDRVEASLDRFSKQLTDKVNKP